MKQTIFFGVFSAALALMSASAEVDCLKLALSVKAVVSAEQSKVLEIVSAEVGAAPGCACEVVKAAIEGSSAKPETVAAIVEAAVIAAPDQIRIIAQCAIAVAPDAFRDVQVVVAKLDPNRGDGSESAKGAKAPAGEAAAVSNPLDFPGDTVEGFQSAGEIQGGSSSSDGGGGGGAVNGGSLFGGNGSPGGVNFPPVIINPPKVTETDPDSGGGKSGRGRAN